MATHTQTGRACEEECILNYHALIDEKKNRENNNAKRKKEKKRTRKIQSESRRGDHQ